MDPNATLASILDVAREIVDCEEDNGGTIYEMCRMIGDLDDWLQAGGFLPQRWQKAGGVS